MGRWLRPKQTAGEEEEEAEKEYELDVVPDRLKSSRSSRAPPLRCLSRPADDGDGGFLRGHIVHPDNEWYWLWTRFIVFWAAYSSFLTPFEFGFFRGLPWNLFLLDIVGQIAFLIDIVLRFLVAYRDPDTHRIVYNPTSIAVR